MLNIFCRLSMAVPFSKTTLRVPLGFQGLLEGLVYEVLLTQPNDIYGFAAMYFENMLEIRAGYFLHLLTLNAAYGLP